MNTLVRKISNLGLLKIEFAVGSLTMAAAVICPPIGIAVTNAELLLNPYVLGRIFLFRSPIFLVSQNSRDTGRN